MDMQEDDLQAAREKAARARERHLQEQEQRRRKLWPRRDEAEEGTPTEDLEGESTMNPLGATADDVQADLPGLQEVLSTPNRDDLAEDWEDWMDEEEPEGSFFVADEFADPGERDFSAVEEDGYEELETPEEGLEAAFEEELPTGEDLPETPNDMGGLNFYADTPEPPKAPAATAPSGASGRGELSQQHDEKKARLDQLKDEMERIERERKQLESLRRKQEEYERSKDTATAGLKRQLGVISKELQQIEELSKELLTTQTRFETILNELESIQEESWANSELEEQLNGAIGKVEVAREEMSRAESRLRVLRPEVMAPGQPQPARVMDRPKPTVQPSAAPGVASGSRSGVPGVEPVFSDLVRKGLAYSLPGIVTALFLFLLLMIFLILQQSAMIY